MRCDMKKYNRLLFFVFFYAGRTAWYVPCAPNRFRLARSLAATAVMASPLGNDCTIEEEEKESPFHQLSNDDRR